MRRISVKLRTAAAVLALALSLAGLTLAVEAAGSDFSEYSGRENCQAEDQAGLFSARETETIRTQVESLEETTGWDVMAVTVSDTEGSDSASYAEEWFDQRTTKDDGILCLIDMENREIVLRTFGEAIRYLTDRRIDAILDNAYGEISEGNYGAGMEAMLEGAGHYYGQGIPNNQYNYDEDTHSVSAYAAKERGITPAEIFIAAGIALAAGAAVCLIIIGRYRLKFGGYKYSIEKNGAVKLSVKRDTFVNQFVTHRHIPKPENHSGDGQSTVHTGSGGRSSGGGSRGF